MIGHAVRSLAAKRVAFLTAHYPPRPGAAARSSERVARALARAGFEIVVVAAGEPGGVPLDPVADMPGLTVHWVVSALEALALIDLIDAEQPFDLVHAFTPPASDLVHNWPSFNGRPLVVTLRGPDGPGTVDTSDVAALARLTAALFVTSPSTTTLARRANHLPAACIPYGIDRSGLPNWRATASNAGVVGTIAGPAGQPAIRGLYHAYERLPAACRRQLVVMTEFAAFVAREPFLLAHDADGRARELRVMTNTRPPRFLAMLPRLRVFVAAAGDEDSFAGMLLAAAAGVPIVAVEDERVTGVLTHDVDALIVPPGDAAAMTAAIEALLTRDDLASRFSAAARAAVRDWTIEEEASRYGSIYHQMLTGVSV